MNVASTICEQKGLRMADIAQVMIHTGLRILASRQPASETEIMLRRAICALPNNPPDNDAA